MIISEKRGFTVMLAHETERIRNFVAKQLSSARMAHTERVLTMALEMADAFHCEQFLVDRDALTVSSLYHDRAKEMPQAEQINLLTRQDTSERVRLAARYGAVAHGYTAASLLPLEFPDLASTAAIEAVRYHTTGRPNMTPIELLLFLADFTEEGRVADSCVRAREYVRDAYGKADAHSRLYEITAFVLRETVDYLTEKKRDIHPDTHRALQYYMTKIAKA